MVTAKSRSKLFDRFALIFWGTIGGVVLFISILAFSQWSIFRMNEKRQKADLAELSSLFEKAISDGSVQDNKGREFMIRPLRGRIYIISFTNSLGEMSEVVVAPALETRNLWKFHQVTPAVSNPDFYLNMINTQ